MARRARSKRNDERRPVRARERREHRGRSRPARRRRARRGSSSRPRAPGSARRCRSPRSGRRTAMSARAAACANGYRLTTTRSIGVMPCAASAAQVVGAMRGAPGCRRAPCGCSVLTRPSIISGKPGDVRDADDRQAGLRQGLGRAAGGDELPPGRGQGRGKRHQAGLVGNTQQRAHEDSTGFLGHLGVGHAQTLTV